MGIWVSMKTTIELPEALFRRAKSMAAQEGVTLKQLLTQALESRLDVRGSARDGKAAAPRWMRAYGALRHLRQERKAIERAIESEFEKIEPEDRL
jgi:predicted DNA-binding ribbon-helix-helix protein